MTVTEKAAYDKAIDDAIAIINNCRNTGESDLRQARDRIGFLKTESLEDLLKPED